VLQVFRLSGIGLSAAATAQTRSFPPFSPLTRNRTVCCRHRADSVLSTLPPTSCHRPIASVLADCWTVCCRHRADSVHSTLFRGIGLSAAATAQTRSSPPYFDGPTKLGKSL
jgi:hypothetical protein